MPLFFWGFDSPHVGCYGIEVVACRKLKLELQLGLLYARFAARNAGAFSSGGNSLT